MKITVGDAFEYPSTKTKVEVVKVTPKHIWFKTPANKLAERVKTTRDIFETLVNNGTVKPTH